MNEDRVLELETRWLKAYQIAMANCIPEPDLPQYDVQVRAECDAQHLVACITREVMGEKMGAEKIVARYPATWVDAVKLRFFPAWLLRRFPARRKIVWVSGAALFPEYKPPRGLGAHTVRIN